MSSVRTTHQPYTPPQEILHNYAHVMVECALGNGRGIASGDVVYVQCDIDALPLAREVYRVILELGGHPMMKIHDEALQRTFMEYASDDQLDFFPKKHLKSLVDTIDHRMYIMAPRDPFYLQGIDPTRMTRSQRAGRMYRKWLNVKQDRGGLTWTLCLYGTPGQAKEAGMTIQEYWDQIIQACFLNEQDPVAKWRSVGEQISAVRDALSAMPIASLHVVSEGTDLKITLGEQRKWLSGSGANIPSFEIFTSPDWRGTEGHIYFNYPLYRMGTVIKDIRLTCKNGRIVKAQARHNEQHLHAMIKQKNADKIGEYSLTDIDHSKISAFMANTLYDENYGGQFGNTHLAIGASFHEAFTGDKASMTARQWKELGFNESPEHTDMMSTHDRVVTATMRDGTERVVYAKGHFVL